MREAEEMGVTTPRASPVVPSSARSVRGDVTSVMGRAFSPDRTASSTRADQGTSGHGPVASSTSVRSVSSTTPSLLTSSGQPSQALPSASCTRRKS